MLESIYASKIYKASKRKDQIRAAFDNPVNKELVGQLADALDEEYQKPDLVSKKSKQMDKPDEVDEMKSEKSEKDTESEEKDFKPKSSPKSSPKPHPTLDKPDISDKKDEGPKDEKPSTDKSSAPEPKSDAPSPSSDVSESTSVEGKRIVASKVREKFVDMKEVSDEIKGMLNFKDSTCGVSRILVKDNELWIYYNDDVNLNNIMDGVIELLNAASYTYLEFNRLARSDNAMVFQINFRDTYRAVNPINPLEYK